jgi:hypothetical protein
MALRSADMGKQGMQAKAVVFLRRSGADGIGHVGWAFDNGDGTFTAGSIENPHHSLHTNPHAMGFWIVRAHDPIIPMRERRYNEFKVIDLGQGDLNAAIRVVKWVSRQPYEIIGHNCMNATYDVLRAYGVDRLPVPAHHWEPNHWFDRVQGRHYKIDVDDVQLESNMGAATSGPVQTDVESLFSDSSSTIEPLQPAWRTANTPAWREFEAARAAAQAPSSAGNHHLPAQKRLLNKIRQLLRLAYDKE